MRLKLVRELTLNLGLDIVDGVRGLHLEGDGLAREGLDEDLHDEDLGFDGQFLTSLIVVQKSM